MSHDRTNQPGADPPAPRVSGAEADLQAFDNDLQAFNELYEKVYRELKRLAAGVIRRDPHGRLRVSPTTLVNEAWMKLSRSPDMAHLDRPLFFVYATRVMRQILTDRARKQLTKKREGQVVTLDDALMAGPWSLERYLELESALNRLAEAEPQLARIFELRFFTGFEHAEIGQRLGLTERQVRGRWTMARHWLRREIQTD